MPELTGRTTIITGAGGHIAKALAGLFAREGSAVAGFDVSEEALKGFTLAVNEVGGRSLAVACDLCDWCSLKAAVDRTIKAFGSVDVLINAATARTDPAWKGIEDVTHEEFTRLMEVGPLGAFGVMKMVFPHMKEKGGKIINFGSGSGRYPARGLGAYGVSKAAMHSMTKVAALEWARYRINVNGILPFAMTPAMEKTLKEDPERLQAYMPPLDWIGDAGRDIGRVALFLATSASDYVTGQNLPVDGGVDMML